MFLNSEYVVMKANGQERICEVLLFEGNCKPEECNNSCVIKYGTKSSGRCFPDDTCNCRIDCSR